MHGILTILTLCLLLTVAATGPLTALEIGDRIRVQTTDGRDLNGLLLSAADADPLLLRIRTGSMRAVLRIPQAEIAALSDRISPRQAQLTELAQRARALRADPQTDADAIHALALQAAALDDPLLARQLHRATLELDPEHGPANQAVGNVLHEGRWMSVAAANRAQGLVWYDGAWIPAALAAEQQAAAEREHAAAAAEREQAMERLAAARRRSEPSPLTTVPPYHQQHPSLLLHGTVQPGCWTPLPPQRQVLIERRVHHRPLIGLPPFGFPLLGPLRFSFR